MSPTYIDKDEINRRAEIRARQMVQDARIERLADRDPEDRQDSAWHLDKRVPIAMIGAFLFQTVTLVYVGTSWKVETDSRIVSLEKSDAERKPQEGRLIVVEQKLTYIVDSLGRIERKIDDDKGQNIK